MSRSRSRSRDKDRKERRREKEGRGEREKEGRGEREREGRGEKEGRREKSKWEEPKGKEKSKEQGPTVFETHALRAAALKPEPGRKQWITFRTLNGNDLKNKI